MSTRKDLTSFFKSKIFAFVIPRVLTMITQTAGSKVDIFCAKVEAFFVRKVKHARFFRRISKRTKPIDHFRVTLVPLFQNESTCKTYHTKRSLVCKKMKLLAEDIFIYEWFYTKTRFDTEAKANSKMAYFSKFMFRAWLQRFYACASAPRLTLEFLAARSRATSVS